MQRGRTGGMDGEREREAQRGGRGWLLRGARGCSEGGGQQARGEGGSRGCVRGGWWPQGQRGALRSWLVRASKARFDLPLLLITPPYIACPPFSRNHCLCCRRLSLSPSPSPSLPCWGLGGSLSPSPSPSLPCGALGGGGSRGCVRGGWWPQGQRGVLRSWLDRASKERFDLPLPLITTPYIACPPFSRNLCLCCRRLK